MLRIVALVTLSLSLPSAPTIARPAAALSAGSVPGGAKTEQRRVVAVIKAPDADGTCQEIVTRIIAELMADGTPVVALTCAASDLECIALSGTRVAAVVVVQLRDNARDVEVRASDASLSAPGQSTVLAAVSGRVQRVADSHLGAPPAALAVRTVELLRAMLFDAGERQSASSPARAVRQVDDRDTELEVTAKARKPDEPEEPDVPEEPVAPPGRVVPMGPNNVTMSIGAAMMGSFSGLSTAYGPMLKIGRRTSDHVMLSVVLAGPAFGRDQRNAAGTVAIRHEMAALQADLLGLFARHFVLRAGLAAGVYHLNVDGQPNQLQQPSPLEPFIMGQSTGGFAGVLSWSGGIVANIRPDIGVFVDGHLFVLTPTPVVLLNGIEVGRAGNPGVTVTAGVELRL